jgi:hypothetical protein
MTLEKETDGPIRLGVWLKTHLLVGQGLALLVGLWAIDGFQLFPPLITAAGLLLMLVAIGLSFRIKPTAQMRIGTRSHIRKPAETKLFLNGIFALMASAHLLFVLGFHYTLQTTLRHDAMLCLFFRG